MSDVIVIGGKGGAGKTTIAALLVLMLVRRKMGPVLAVDADPNNTLGNALGVNDAATVADVVDAVAKNPDIVPPNMGKDAFIEFQIHKGITEADGFDLLVMGRPEGPGCYCYINNVLRNLMAKLIAEYRFVVIDNEAGLEHFSRKTTRACDTLIVVSDETPVGLLSARRIFHLVDELGIPAGKKFLVVNRCRGGMDFKKCERDFGVDGAFAVPLDEKIGKAGSEGDALKMLRQDHAVVQAVDRLGDRLWPKN